MWLIGCSELPQSEAVSHPDVGTNVSNLHILTSLLSRKFKKCQDTSTVRYILYKVLNILYNVYRNFGNCPPVCSCDGTRLMPLAHPTDVRVRLFYHQRLITPTLDTTHYGTGEAQTSLLRISRSVDWQSNVYHILLRETSRAMQCTTVCQSSPNERSPILHTEQYGSSVSQAKSAFDPICTIKIIESIHRKRWQDKVSM